MSDARLVLGDCLTVMREMEPNSVDTVICDPPYGLTEPRSGGNGTGQMWATRSDDTKEKRRGGFMGKDWDHAVPGIAFWAEMLRVAKPGAFLLAFGGTRTHHRLMVAIEDAGWEIRDCLMWLYAQGFPKSHDISKAIDKAAGAAREVIGPNPYNDRRPNPPVSERYQQAGWPSNITAPATDAAREWDGWGTALKPAVEIIVMAMKPLDGTFAQNALRWGVAGLAIDAARVGTSKDVPSSPSHTPFAKGSSGFKPPDMTSAGWDANIGRWPSNLILTCTCTDRTNGAHTDPDCPCAMLDAQSGERRNGGQNTTSKGSPGMFGIGATNGVGATQYAGDSGGASRFFAQVKPDASRMIYAAKASRAERNRGLEGMEERETKPYAGNINKLTDLRMEGQQNRLPQANGHPCVKPLSLCRYLAKLTRSPTGGVVLDPFMGSGSIGVGALMEGRDFVGIEISEEYMEIARRRIEHAQMQMSLELVTE